MRCGGHAPSKEAASADAPVPCLKLFGRTVLVTESHKLSSPSAGNVVQNSKSSSPIVEIERQDKIPYMDMGAPDLPLLQGALPGDFLSPRGTWSPWSAGMLPMFYPLPSKYGDSPSPTDPRVMPMPLWALCGNLPLPFLHQQNLSLTQFISQPCAEASSDRVVQKECSGTGSNTPSAAEGARTVSSKCTELGQSVENGDNAALSSQRAGSDKAGRGFVPYKRCVVGREGQHPQSMSDDGEGQSIGLCL